MSSYITTVIHKKNGTFHTCFCFDDHFGKHKYGYQIDNQGPVLTDEQLTKDYKMKDSDNG